MNIPDPPPVHQTVETAYNQWSTTYDVQENPTRDLDALVLKRIVPDLAGLTVVEAGCGTGKNTSWLAPRCANLIGLDLSEGMLVIARRKVSLPHVRFIQHNLLESWPVASSSADLVLINLVLEHIEQLEPIFTHAATVMQPGATLIVSEFHPARVKLGHGARFTDERGKDERKEQDQRQEQGEEQEGRNGKIAEIINFVHEVDEYERVASAVGLQLNDVQEWDKKLLGQESELGLPLLLSLHFTK